MRSLPVFLFVIATVFLGCDSGPGNVNCPGITKPAVEVEVVNATTGRYLAAEAEAVIKDGEYQDTLRHGTVTQSEPALIVKTLEGGFGRPGTYDLSIEHPDYQSWTLRGVEAPSTECGVETQNLEAGLREKETDS